MLLLILLLTLFGRGGTGFRRSLSARYEKSREFFLNNNSQNVHLKKVKEWIFHLGSTWWGVCSKILPCEEVLGNVDDLIAGLGSFVSAIKNHLLVQISFNISFTKNSQIGKLKNKNWKLKISRNERFHAKTVILPNIRTYDILDNFINLFLMYVMNFGFLEKS